MSQERGVSIGRDEDGVVDVHERRHRDSEVRSLRKVVE